jgi:hypothetical protein
MPYTINGNVLTWKGGTAILTPMTVNGGTLANSTNNGPINLVVKNGSRDGDATEAEADTNLFGRLVTSGNAKTSLELSAYVSQANLTAPMTPGTPLLIMEGDYVNAEIKGGMTTLSGVFMISKISETYDPNEVMNLDLSLSSHGNLKVSQRGVVTANGTATALTGDLKP